MLLQDEHWAVQHEVMQSYVAYARSSASEDIRDVIPRGLLPGALLLAPVMQMAANICNQNAHMTEHVPSPPVAAAFAAFCLHGQSWLWSGRACRR